MNSILYSIKNKMGCELAIPQVTLFTVLIIIIVWLTTRDPCKTIMIGGLAFYLGYAGYLDRIGIGGRDVIKIVAE
jgi:hypothetical protein